MFDAIFGSWQDVLVTLVAVSAALIVVWRTLGTWSDSKPGGSGGPGCDHCAIGEELKKGHRS